MENNEAVETVDSRLSIVRDLASDIRKMILVMIASDNDQDIVKYAKGINQNLNNIEQEYFKAIRELAIEQTISTSLVQVLSGSEEKHEEAQPNHDENESVQQVIEFPSEERGETKAVEHVDEFPFIEESQDEAKVKEVQDEKVTNILDKIVKVKPIPTWQEKAREFLKDEPVKRIVGRDVYVIPPDLAPISIKDVPGTVQYIEAIDKYNLNYLLIKRSLERHTTKYGTFVEETIVIDVEDEEVVMDFVEGRDKCYRYLDSDNNLTQYSKFIIDSNKFPYEIKVDKKAEEPSFKEEAKQKLVKDTIYNTGGQRYYLVSGIPSEEYGSNTVSYIEGFDADTLEYLLIEVSSDFNRNVTSDVIIRIDDEDELRRHVEGKPFTFKYLTPDGHFTDYAKKLIVRQMVKGTGE